MICDKVEKKPCRKEPDFFQQPPAEGKEVEFHPVVFHAVTPGQQKRQGIQRQRHGNDAKGTASFKQKRYRQQWAGNSDKKAHAALKCESFVCRQIADKNSLRERERHVGRHNNYESPCRVQLLRSCGRMKQLRSMTGKHRPHSQRHSAHTQKNRHEHAVQRRHAFPIASHGKTGEETDVRAAKAQRKHTECRNDGLDKLIQPEFLLPQYAQNKGRVRQHHDDLNAQGRIRKRDARCALIHRLNSLRFRPESVSREKGILPNRYIELPFKGLHTTGIQPKSKRRLSCSRSSMLRIGMDNRSRRTGMNSL